jgi:hypothetical protein
MCEVMTVRLMARGRLPTGPAELAAGLRYTTLVCHLKKVMHRGWAYFQARLAFTMAAFHVLVQWYGFQPTASGFVPLSMAELSL